MPTMIIKGQVLLTFLSKDLKTLGKQINDCKLAIIKSLFELIKCITKDKLSAATATFLTNTNRRLRQICRNANDCLRELTMILSRDFA